MNKEENSEFRENHDYYEMVARRNYTDAIGIEYVASPYRKEIFTDMFIECTDGGVTEIVMDYILRRPREKDPLEIVREFCIGDEGVGAFAEWYYSNYISKENEREINEFHAIINILLQGAQ